MWEKHPGDNHSDLHSFQKTNLSYDDYKKNPFENNNNNYFPSSKNIKYTERNWGSIFGAIKSTNNKYKISDLAYYYLLKRAKDKYHELLKKSKKYEANFHKMKQEYIEENKKKHLMQLRLQHKDHFNEDLLKRMNCINLFTKNLRKNALRRKSIHHVQFDETYSINSNNQNSSSLKRLLSGETGNICNQSVPLLSINNTNPVNINNNNNAHNIINTTESRITLNDLKPKRITKKKLVNIVCGDMVYEDTQKIKLFDGKFFSAYIYMDENINNDDKKNEKKVGKSIRSYVDDKENNTVFIDKYSSNNIEYKKTHISQGSSKSLLIKNKLKEINNRSLSEIPMKVLHSSSKSNLSQSSKLNLLLLKGRNFNESKKLNNKKLISNTSINFNVSNFNTNINVNNNTKDNQNKESLNNKELMMNQSQDKSNLNEIDNKINHSVFLKTIMKTNSLKRSSTPIIIRDEIFENENKEKSINKSIIKMNSCYGLSFKNKSLNSKNFDFLKKDDLYYSKKFYD